MIEILSMQFIQRALIAGLFVGFLGSYFGVFVVQRKMSFLGSGLAHSAFGGVALGLLLNTEPLWVALPFTVLVAILISWLKHKTNLENDTTIGILFSLSMALGIIFLAMKKDYSIDAFSYLFGSILSVSQSDLIVSSIVTLITISTFFKLWGRWAYSGFDNELARSDRLNVDLDDYLLSIFVAVSIVISIKLVGIVLIAAFLVIPPAAAKLFSNTFFKMTVLSIIIGLFSSIAGIILSIAFDIPTGAMIIVVQISIFIFGMFYYKLRIE